MAQTSRALARGFGFRLPVQADGVFGRGVAVKVLRGRSAIWPKTVGPAASMPLIDDTALEVLGGDLACQIEELEAGISHVRFTGTHMLYVAKGSPGTHYTIAPATGGFADGQMIAVRSGIEGVGLAVEDGRGADLRAAATALRRGENLRLRFDGMAGRWREVGGN